MPSDRLTRALAGYEAGAVTEKEAYVEILLAAGEGDAYAIFARLPPHFRIAIVREVEGMNRNAVVVRESCCGVGSRTRYEADLRQREETLRRGIVALQKTIAGIAQVPLQRTELPMIQTEQTTWTPPAWLRLTLVTLTVGGGFTGLSITSQYVLSSHQAISPGVAAICVAFVLLYCFVTVSGLIFVQNPQRMRPLFIALALQIPLLSSPIIAYRFTAGLEASVLVSQAGVSSLLVLGGKWQFNLFQPLLWGIGVNFVPIVLLFALARARRRAIPSQGLAPTITNETTAQPESSQPGNDPVR